MGIYPKIELPTLTAPTSESTLSNKISPKFDWLYGEFSFSKDKRIRFDDPKESFKSWCLKILCTERGTRACYSDKIGVEFEQRFQNPSPQSVKSAIVRTITESLMIHPRTIAVKNFRFAVNADQVTVSFDVLARDFGTISLDLNLN